MTSLSQLTALARACSRPRKHPHTLKQTRTAFGECEAVWRSSTKIRTAVAIRGIDLEDVNTLCSISKAANECRAPIDWETPSGKKAQVNLELQLSAFTGYGKADEDAYLGLQAHGILWVADPTQTPVNWPIAPPIVAGKVLLHSTCMQ